MTGYTVHTGTTVKFAGGWDRVFSGKKPAKGAPATSKAVKKTAAKAKKKAAKPAAKKGRRTK